MTTEEQAEAEADLDLDGKKGNVPRPGGFTKCGEEDDVCQCDGTVWFIPDNGDAINAADMERRRHAIKDVEGQINCDVESLGVDPSPGRKKMCVCQSKPLKTTPQAKKCAEEGENCECKVGGSVYFGATKGKFENIFRSKREQDTYAVKKVLTGGSIECSSKEFGDVAPNKPKTCFCDEAKEPVYKLGKEFAAEKCADEGGDCNCTSTVHYGKLGEDFSDMMQLSHKTKKLNGTEKLTGHVQCSSSFFGDPMPNKKKQCFCERQMKPLGGKIDNKTESVKYCGSEGENC